MVDRIKPGDGSWEFPQLEEGDYTLEFMDRVEISKKEDDKGNTIRTIRLPLKVHDGDGMITIFCPLKGYGLQKLIEVICYASGNLAKILSKDLNEADLESSGWKPETLMSEELFKALKVKIPNRVIGATVKRNKNGYAEIKKVYRAGEVPQSETAENTTSNEEESGW